MSSILEAESEGKTRSPSPAPGSRVGPAGLFRVAVGFGLVAGWIELASVVLRRTLDPRISMDALRTNRHFAWMIPVSDVLIFAAVGLGIALFARYQPGLARRLAWRFLTALTALAVLLSIEGLYVPSSLILACGLGASIGPAIDRRAGRHRRIARVGPRVLALGLVALTMLIHTRVTTAERRALSGLPPAPPQSPNVVLIVLDNVRAESLSLHGRARPTTPELERLARQGIQFTEASATAPWTLPSHASMFTGRWAQQLAFDYDRPLDATYPTLAEVLAGHGYATAGFVGNTYYGHQSYGLGRGFARYEDDYENLAVSPFEILRSSGLGKRVIQLCGYPIHVESGGTSLRKTAEMLNRDVLGWLADQPSGRPFFVFLNYFDAHSPFIPPDGPTPRFGLGALAGPEQAKILKRYQRMRLGTLAPGQGDRGRIEHEATEVWLDSYESCIASLDRQIGRLFDELGRRGLRENTLIIVTSDHGEHFKEHGFLGHGLSLYRRELHVPLLIFTPTASPAGQRVAEPVSLRDLPATILDLLGLEGPSPFPGRSLARFWTEGPGSRPGPDPILAEVRRRDGLQGDPLLPAARGNVDSLVVGGKVYIRDSTGREELFDQANDPLELHDLTAEARLVTRSRASGPYSNGSGASRIR